MSRVLPNTYARLPSLMLSELFARNSDLSVTGVPGLLLENALLRRGDLADVTTDSKSKYPWLSLFSKFDTLIGGGLKGLLVLPFAAP